VKENLKKVLEEGKLTEGMVKDAVLKALKVVGFKKEDIDNIIKEVKTGFENISKESKTTVVKGSNEF